MEFECPRCSECINDEELIEGRCPICGWCSEMNAKKELRLSYDALTLFYEFVNRVKESMYYPTEEYLDYNDKNASILTVHDFEDGEMQCNFKLIPTFVDAVKLKKCSSCGRLHFKSGGKLLKVEVAGDAGRHHIVYFCKGCCD